MCKNSGYCRVVIGSPDNRVGKPVRMSASASSAATLQDDFETEKLDATSNRIPSWR
jgi:hypothetical protein